jgi:ribosome-binding protein aMBF1 (putative translation factor)
MEWHRGEFIPLKTTTPQGKKGKGKVVTITQDTADQMNQDFSKKRGVGVKIKYIALEEKAKKEKKAKKKESLVPDATLKDLQAKYQEVFKKKAYYGWNAEELTKRINEKINK